MLKRKCSYFSLSYETGMKCFSIAYSKYSINRKPSDTFRTGYVNTVTMQHRFINASKFTWRKSSSPGRPGGCLDSEVFYGALNVLENVGETTTIQRPLYQTKVNLPNYQLPSTIKGSTTIQRQTTPTW